MDEFYIEVVVWVDAEDADEATQAVAATLQENPGTARFDITNVEVTADA